MPIYEYQCLTCGSKSEVMQRVGDPPPGVCSECGGELRKLFSAPSFQFKGSGWYVTDYARKSEGKSGEKSSKDSGKDSSSESSSESSAKTEPAAKTTETTTKPSTPTSSSS